MWEIGFHGGQIRNWKKQSDTVDVEVSSSGVSLFLFFFFCCRWSTNSVRLCFLVEEYKKEQNQKRISRKHLDTNITEKKGGENENVKFK